MIQMVLHGFTVLPHAFDLCNCCITMCNRIMQPHYALHQELRASNDDRANRDLQLDGGGISDKPVVISVYPTAQAGNRCQI